MTDDMPGDSRRREQSLFEELAAQPMEELVGIVDSDGVGGAQLGRGEPWTLLVSFTAWKRRTGGISETWLTIRRRVAESELEEFQDLIEPESVVRIRARVAEQNSFGAPQAQLEGYLGVVTDDAEMNAVLARMKKSVTVEHEILGQIVKENKHADAAAQIRYCNRDIQIRIIEDDAPYDQSIALAATVVTQLERLDAAAKQIASTQLTETYNNGWNEYDQAQEDGTFKTISNPRLTEQEFANKLTLIAVNVTGGAMLDLFYDDENMFWGHAVVVNSLNGVDMTDAHAEIFG